MLTKRLGDSDLDVTPVILGAWAIGGSMWGGQDEGEAIAAIHASLDAGVTTIDTAPVYGGGRSEEIVGKALRGRRDRVIVATKCGLEWKRQEGTYKFTFTDVDGSPTAVHHDLSPARIRRECEDSLRRLGTDVIDLYQIHWPDPAAPVADAFPELLKLREKGKVRWLGVSNFSPAEIETARKVGGIVSLQPSYSLLDRGIEAEILPTCRRENVGVIVYSPMGRGLLSGKITADHQFPENDHRRAGRFFQPEARKKALAALERARPMAEKYGVSLANLAVAWTLATPGVTAAIVGARTPEQARENARAASVQLSGEDHAELGRLFA
jgi:aryl-alcohol dehydrogenase-like predicted oxidoreductase